MAAGESSTGRSRLSVRTVALVATAALAAAGFALAWRARPEHAAGSRAPAGHTAPGVPAGPESLPPVEVAVEAVHAEPLMEPLRVTGTLRTDETVVLSTKATGLVRAVYAREGDRVRRGQLLVLLDDGDLQAQRARAVAAVRAAESQVAEAEAAVRAAEARFEQAKTSRTIKDAAAESEYRRAEQGLEAARARLAQARAMAGIAGTEAETRVATARAALQAARERLKALQDGARRQERAAAEAQVARTQAQVARMKAMLERREQLLRDKAIAEEAVDNARRDYEAALADLEAARQQLSLVQEGPRTEEIRAQEEVVRQAEAALRDAEANRARRQISDEDVEAAEAQVRQAEAALEAARAALAQRQWNEDEVRTARAAVGQARAALLKARATANQARAEVRYQDELIAQTRIYSPVDGVVTSRSVQPGAAVVQMRNELMTIVSSSTLYFEATAPETALPQLRAGLPAEVRLDSAPGRTFRGVVREIIPVAEGSNRSVRLRISFPRPPEGRAVVGGFARAILRGETQPVLSVPRRALVSDEGVIAVFVLENGRAVRRPITIGDPGGTGERVPVLSGLRAGERVIVEGAERLTDGQEVRVRAEGDR